MPKKKTNKSPTQRTMDLLRKGGWSVGIVEKWNRFANIRQDLFGCIDLVAMNGTETIGIQATSGDNVSKRIQKIKKEPRALIWINSGNRLYVHGWRKLVKTGRWEVREIEITKAVFEGVEAA